MPTAVVLTQFGIGNLTLEGRAPEPLRSGHVRVRIRAVSLNYRDLLVVRGHYGIQELPLIPCSDAAGEVVEVGARVHDLKAGDRVCTHMAPSWSHGRLTPAIRATTLGGPLDGVLCEERVLPAAALVRFPTHLDFAHAACLPVAGLTAWHALNLINDGDSPAHVLLLGTGGVSLFGLALAKAQGRRVAITSGSEHKRARAQAMGADLVLDRTRPGWSSAARRWSGGGVDLVLEVGGAGTFSESVHATRDDGCIALIGVLSQAGVNNLSPASALAEVLMRRIRVQGVFVGPRCDLETLVQFAALHGITPQIGELFDGLGRVRHAFAALHGGAQFGKCVIVLDG